MKTSTKTTQLLKATDMELKAILERDIKKLAEAKYAKNRNAAFLQLIAA